MAYVTVPEGALWRCKTDGSERLQLSFPPQRAAFPRWSPNGKRIAYVASLPSNPWKIYSVSSEGGRPEVMMQGKESESEPGWSPDGKRLVFGGLSSEVSTSALAIHLLDLQTHQTSALPGSQGLYAPRWSPDGRYIVAQRAGPENLWLFHLEDQKWEELTKQSVGYFTWSRDGDYIYFDSVTMQREAAFYRLRPSNHRLDQVASLKGFPRIWGMFGPWSGLTPDDSPLLLRNVGSEEIYALDWEAP